MITFVFLSCIMLPLIGGPVLMVISQNRREHGCNVCPWLKTDATVVTHEVTLSDVVASIGTSSALDVMDAFYGTPQGDTIIRPYVTPRVHEVTS